MLKIYKIDFYYWGSMCPISNEIIKTLSIYNDVFEIHFHDITNDLATAKELNIFFPFLTVVNNEKRYYAPITEAFLQSLTNGIMPIETPYKITMGRIEKSVNIQPITKSNYTLASRCTGRSDC